MEAEAKRIIQRIFADISVSQETTREILESLREEIEYLIDTLE
jgi:hypothetical protein